MYAVRAEVSSPQQELVQIPIKVYVNGNSAALIMAQAQAVKTDLCCRFLYDERRKIRCFDFT